MKNAMKVLLCTFFATSSVMLAQPKLEIVGGDTYNWGTIKPADSPLKCTVVLKNAGTENLIIKEVKPGCGCTSAPISKNTIVPGDTASLAVKLNISGNASDVTKSIRITSNDADHPNKNFYLKAKIFHPISIGPTQYFTFNDMQVGVKKEAKLKFKNNTSESITLSDFDLPANVTLSVMGKVILAPNEEIEITAYGNGTAAGYFTGTVKMKTSSEDMKTISLQCYGNVKDSPLNAQ